MPFYTLHLEACRRLRADYYLLRFKRPTRFSFTPGQYIRFHHQGVVRDYTLINAPDDTHLEICLRHLPEGRFTPALVGATAGQTFDVEGPLGYFRFQSDPATAVFVATGSGIAPFVAYVRAGVRGFTLLHGAATAAALLFGEEMRSAAADYQTCLSKSSSGDATQPGETSTGRVTDLLRSMPPRHCHFYLCGSAAMIGDALNIIDDRFEGATVFTERFY
ncbi:MAG: FAD-binding oxidoreductase [Desulfosarcinaceae bacterium]|nr:FAD-binding oxidoreductase [Desulfosarcinaceae bacterium]